VSRILIFSDNEALCNLWITALSAQYQVDIISEMHTDIHASAAIIDSDKIDTNNTLFSFFNKMNIRFLIVGMDWPEENQIKALIHGASGYCNESEPPHLLLQAIDSILKGDIWIKRHLVPKVIGALIQMKSSHTEQFDQQSSIESSYLLQSLSSREHDVARMIRLGQSNKTIASNLSISERTVKAHLTSIFKKLNVPDRLHLALFIKEFG
jgi:DNA-binding NarL/FixJ family response regulator